MFAGVCTICYKVFCKPGGSAITGDPDLRQAWAEHRYVSWNSFGMRVTGRGPGVN